MESVVVTEQKRTEATPNNFLDMVMSHSRGLLAASLLTGGAATLSAQTANLREVPSDTPGLLTVVKPVGSGASVTNYYLPTEVVKSISFVNDSPIETGGFVTGAGEFNARGIPLLSSTFGKPVLVERVGARFNINDSGENAPFHDPRDNEFYRVTVWDGKENTQSIALPWVLGSGVSEYTYPQDPTACRSVIFSSATKEVVGRPELGQTINWIERPEFHSWQISANVAPLGMIVESGNVVAGINPIAGAYVSSGTYTEVTTVSGAAVPGTESLLRGDSLEHNRINIRTTEYVTSRPGTSYTLAHRLPLLLQVRELEQVTVVPKTEPAPNLVGIVPLEDGKFEITFSPAIALNANNLPSGISVRGTDDLSSWREVQVLSGKTNSVVFSAKDPAGNIPDKAFYQLIKK